MLRDGKFIKETPPKIGCNYIPPFEREYSDGEQAMQEINLGNKPQMDFKESDVLFRILMIYSALALLYALFKK
jgi:hypothetical protein